MKGVPAFIEYNEFHQIYHAAYYMYFHKTRILRNCMILIQKNCDVYLWTFLLRGLRSKVVPGWAALTGPLGKTATAPRGPAPR